MLRSSLSSKKHYIEKDDLTILPDLVQTKYLPMMRSVLLLCILLISNSLWSKNDPIEKCLNKKLEGLTSIKALGPKFGFEEVYDIRILQPLDHNHPETGQFEQRIFLYHKDRKKPVVFVTEGYSLLDRKYELCDILNANQISVEYRYFGKSVPENPEWQFLKNAQAAEDLHRIRQMFGKIYKKEWISTGISKGGTTTMMYKALYPKDVDASVNYVGPLPLAQEDKRMDDHLASIGSDECRKKLSDFQIDALTRRDAILPKVDSLAAADQLSFSIGTGAAFEFAVLEYPFSFWQFAHDCLEIPEKSATDHEVFLSLKNIVGYNFYSDATYEFFLPAFYQFMTENGYYGFAHDHVKSLLKDLDRPSNVTFAPRDIEIIYNGEFMSMVNQKLRENGDQIVHIHGQYDPWGAVGYFPDTSQDALLIIKEEAGHGTRISHLKKGDQQKVYDTLAKWLKADILPLKDSNP